MTAKVKIERLTAAEVALVNDIYASRPEAERAALESFLRGPETASFSGAFAETLFDEFFGELDDEDEPSERGKRIDAVIRKLIYADVDYLD